MKPKAAAPKPKNNNSRPEFLRDGKLGRSPFRLRRNPRASLAAPAARGAGGGPPRRRNPPRGRRTPPARFFHGVPASACGPRPPVRFAAPVRYRADSSAWMAAAAFLPAPMANMTVAAPVTASPPA